MNEEDAEKLGKMSADAIIALGVEACTKCPNNNFDANSKKDCDAVETMMLGLMAEDEQFKETFLHAGHALLARGIAILNTKPFDWSRKEKLEQKQAAEMAEFGKYLSAAVIQFIKFPDKKIREKLRRAVGAVR